MKQSECRPGMIVEFGRTNGEKSLGKVVKLNTKTATVELVENRGRAHRAAYQPGGR